MKLLFVLHHYAGTGLTQYFSARPEMRQQRIHSLTECISSIWTTFGDRRFEASFGDNAVKFTKIQSPNSLKIVVCVYQDQHILGELPVSQDLYVVASIKQDFDPLYLGFYAHQVIGTQTGYDYYCHIEDDLIMSDPLFFKKLRWFNQHAGNDCLLLPNRIETKKETKCYIDGYAGVRCHQPKVISLPFLNETVKFIRPDNIYAGSYFLNQPQLDKLLRDGHYMGYDSSWIGPLESCMSLSVQKSFEIYKPTLESGFLEIRHFGDRYVGMI